MDNSKTRRRVPTYGKTTKSLPLPNIFDLAPETQSDLSRPGSHTSLLSLKKQPLEKKRACEPSDPNVQLAEELRKSIEARVKAVSSREGSPYSSDFSSPDFHKGRISQSATSSLFEITSSEDEAVDGTVSSTHKRRKLLPAIRDPDSHHTVRKTTSTQSKTNMPQNVRSQRSPKEIATQPNKQPSLSRKTAGSRPRSDLPRSDLKIPRRKKADVDLLGYRSNTIHGRDTFADQDLQDGRRRTPSRQNHHPLLPNNVSFTSSSDGSEPYADPTSSIQKTPKRRSILSFQSLQEGIVPSPSQLGLKTLRLTPERHMKSDEEDFISSDADSRMLTPRRGRERLVDRLDTPRKPVSSQISRAQSVTSTLDGVEGLPRATSNHSREAVPHTALERQHATVSQTDNAPVTQQASQQGLDKGRTTYARDRSHLSDMILQDLERDSLSAQPKESGYPTVESNPYPISSQLVLDESNSDDEATANVKSIHELRQAGANNRIERELETLFEDIEVTTGSSKALRLQALIELLKKMDDEGFVRRFVEAGICPRLIRLASVEFDIMSATLLYFAFSIVAALEQTGVKLLKQIHRSMIGLSTALLVEGRALSQIARDRRQNLSKSLIREIDDLADEAVLHAVWDGDKPTFLSPQLVALYGEAISIHHLRKLKEPEVPITASHFKQVVSLLNTYSLQNDKESGEGDIGLKIKTATSILDWSDLSTLMSGSLQMLEGKDLIILCQALGEALGFAANESPSLQQAILRVVITVSNNRAFEVVEKNFLNLASCADRGDDLDKQTLDSVILALGALLNLASGSREAQNSMLQPHNTEGSPVDWLVSTFNDRVSLTLEVTTLDQSQVSIAFGHLAMLLCTLCLDENVRPYITSSLHGQSLRELCLAGDLFLLPWKEIEAINPNDQATKAFTNRFSGILAALKQYA